MRPFQLCVFQTHKIGNLCLTFLKGWFSLATESGSESESYIRALYELGENRKSDS